MKVKLNDSGDTCILEGKYLREDENYLYIEMEDKQVAIIYKEDLIWVSFEGE